MQTSDERVLKAVSVLCEIQIGKIITELKCVAAQQKKVINKSNLTFDDLQKSMDEFGVALRRPPLLSEPSRQQIRRNGSSTRNPTASTYGQQLGGAKSK